MQRHLVD